LSYSVSGQRGFVRFVDKQYIKVKRSIAFLKKMIFRNGRLVRDDNRKMSAAMALTYDQRSLVLVVFASAALLCSENHCTGDKP
jgi:hypothetical protein